MAIVSIHISLWTNRQVMVVVYRNYQWEPDVSQTFSSGSSSVWSWRNVKRLTFAATVGSNVTPPIVVRHFVGNFVLVWMGLYCYIVFWYGGNVLRVCKNNGVCWLINHMQLTACTHKMMSKLKWWSSFFSILFSFFDWHFKLVLCVNN